MKFETNHTEFKPVTLTLDTQEDIDFIAALIGSTSEHDSEPFGVDDEHWTEFYNSIKDRVRNFKHFDLEIREDYK